MHSPRRTSSTAKSTTSSWSKRAYWCAGANAALGALGREPLVIGRDQGYIGVLVDDLVTRGTQEPYRMFTSRAEYRLLLRADNADQRLTERGYEAGLVGDERRAQLRKKEAAIAAGLASLRAFQLPNDAWAARVATRGKRARERSD